VTLPRAKISASLADRGRPEMWANEQESAALSGMDQDKYYAVLLKLEAAGFPKRSHWNSKRFIPFIEDFWRREVDPARFDVPKSEPETNPQGNFSHVKGQRIIAR
jgi:hypothetical protein